MACLLMICSLVSQAIPDSGKYSIMQMVKHNNNMASFVVKVQQPPSVLQGTVVWDGLFAHSIMPKPVGWFRIIIFLWFGRKFAEIGSLLCWLAYSSYTTK
jgi:hypothetical protein